MPIHHLRVGFSESCNTRPLDYGTCSMIGKLEPPLRFALPKQAGDGELFGYYAKYIRAIGSGRDGTAHEARLNGVRACVKSYSSWITKIVSNPARSEFQALRKASVLLADCGENLQRGIGWFIDSKHGPVFASELIVDFDGMPSATLSTTPLLSEEYLRQLQEVLSKLEDRRIYWRPASSNILVQRASSSTLRPVLIDFTGCEKQGWLESEATRKSAVAKLLAETRSKVPSTRDTPSTGSNSVLSSLIAPQRMRSEFD
jgi:hypothetical protein